MSRKLIIDTDPGCDDAIAMLLAFASPELDVLGITTVMGNTLLPQVTRNALKICELAGRSDMAVYAGCELPMLVALDSAEVVHGQDGMAELHLPIPTMQPRQTHAVDWIVDTVMSEPEGSVTLCTMASLTNVALAFVKDRRVARRLREIVMMGGSFMAGGNSSRVPVAESNMANDPHAARIVFESGANLTLAPLDITHQTLATPARIAAMAAQDTPVTQIVARIMEFYSRYDVEKMGLEGGPIHDPTLIAWLLEPQLFTARPMHVAIECESALGMGMTIGDWWGATGKGPNANVLTGLDSDGFYRLLTDRVARL